MKVFKVPATLAKAKDTCAKVAGTPSNPRTAYAHLLTLHNISGNAVTSLSTFVRDLSVRAGVVGTYLWTGASLRK